MEHGTTLAQYRIIEKLGEGGMGEVYRATDTRLKRDVAIKVLPAEVAADPDRLVRLEREAQVLARLDHPNIAAIYGIEEAVIDPGESSESAGQRAGEPLRFLVMQLAPGETLDDLLDRRGGASGSGKVNTDAVTAVLSPNASQPDGAALRYRGLPLDEALPIAAAIADALKSAHDEGIIHRDLKPANVKVALDHGTPRVKVLDFGLAKIYQSEATDGDAELSASPTMMAATQSGLIMGTAAYMSPEQARGQRVDQRADIWAFGVLLYEMLTGRRLFHGDTVSDTLASVLKDDIDLTALADDTPLPLRRLLRRCLTRDARKRLHDIADARLEIEEAGTGLFGADADDVATLSGAVAGALADAAALTGGDPWLGRAPRRSLTWWHGVAALLLVVTGAAITLVALPAVTPSERPVRVLGDLGPGAARSAVISPDGTKLVLHIDDDLWVRDFDDLEARRIENSSEYRGRPFWAPDSSRVAFFTSAGLYVASADNGSSARLDYDLQPASTGGTWTNEGIIVGVAARSAGELLLLSPDGGDPRVVARSPSPGRLRQPALMPDGQTLVYEFAERGDGVLSYGTVVVQHGLTPGSATQVILARDDQFVGFQYVEELEVLLAESLYSGIWAIPLARNGFTPAGLPERLLPNGEDMSLSHEGTLVYRALGSRLETLPLRWIDRQGNTIETIASDKRDPRWLAVSPDGTQAAFTGPRAAGLANDIWVLDLQTGAETRITAEPGAGDAPSWRGNDRLVFTGRGPGSPVLSQSASGAGSPEVVVDGGFFRNPASSPDGRYVVFEGLTVDGALRPADVTGGSRRGLDGASPPAGGPGGGGGREGSVWNIYYAEGGGEEPRAFRGTDDNETKPALSPDGSRIAYVSDASGSSEVWVDTFPQPTVPVRISVNGGANVRWSASGEEIIYDDGADALWSVRFDAAVVHSRSAYPAPVRLFAQGDAATRFASFGTRSWDVGANGDAILTIQRYADGISDVNVIENFPRWYRDRR